MSAATANAPKFAAYEKLAPVGYSEVVIDDTIPTTSLDDVGDRMNLATIEEGRTLVNYRIWENGDGDAHATPTLDFDIVLVQGVNDPSEAGTETILYNAGTRFQGASTTLVEGFLNTKLTEKGYNGKAYIRAKVNTAAATAAACSLKITIGVE
jgi:hypothetical protein